METITIPIEEYKYLKNLANFNSNPDLAMKLNQLIDLMYENKHGLFMKDYIDDLAEQSFIDGWSDKPSPWDNV